MCDIYYVYILKCSDETFYTGISSNVMKRLQSHNKGKGAKYTRGRLPCSLVYLEQCESKSAALKREWFIKHKLNRKEKENLVLEYMKKGD